MLYMYSISTDSSQANHNPAIFQCLQALKNVTSLLRQSKSPDNNNVLLMFNNNSYADFRTAYTHVLILS